MKLIHFHQLNIAISYKVHSNPKNLNSKLTINHLKINQKEGIIRIPPITMISLGVTYLTVSSTIFKILQSKTNKLTITSALLQHHRHPVKWDMDFNRIIVLINRIIHKILARFIRVLLELERTHHSPRIQL